jgi:UMF1 family MFS transporter
MGVQTVMYLAASFGDKELGLPGDQLILTVLIIQFVAIGGSYLFAFVSKVFGNKISLMIMVLIWIGICGAAYYVYSVYEFYALAFVVGMVMGGIQSLSRSTFSKLIPEEKVRICVIGDGAPWIWNRIKEIYPDAKKVLDYFHQQI